MSASFSHPFPDGIIHTSLTFNRAAVAAMCRRRAPKIRCQTIIGHEAEPYRMTRSQETVSGLMQYKSIAIRPSVGLLSRPLLLLFPLFFASIRPTVGGPLFRPVVASPSVRASVRLPLPSSSSRL
jgi:hypothetical protein